MITKELPIYNICIDDVDDLTGMTAISLVEYPAVEVDFLAFNKEEEQKKVNFAVNEMEHKITGVAIVCDKPIYRYSELEGGYYVVFNKKTIEDIVLKFSKQKNFNFVDLQHNGEMISGITMIEYFIKNENKGINPKGFENVADGSLFVTYKVEDEDLWQEIIKEDSEFKGFSIEINCTLSPKVEKTELEEVVEGLLSSVKKKDNTLEFLSVGTVLELLDSNKLCNITIDNKKYLGQLYNVTGEGRDATVQIFFPSKKRIGVAMDEWDIEGNYKGANLLDKADYWKTVKVDDIDRITPTSYPILKWNYEVKSFKPVVEYDPNQTTQSQASGGQVNSIDYAMDNNYMVMIEYDDEINTNGKGLRQIWIGHIGETVRNQQVIIAYEYYGDSASGLGGENGYWRHFLTRRIKSFRVNTLEKITEAPEGFNRSYIGGEMEYINVIYRTAQI